MTEISYHNKNRVTNNTNLRDFDLGKSKKMSDLGKSDSLTDADLT